MKKNSIMSNKPFLSNRMKSIGLYVYLILACILVLTPILWMVNASFTKGKLLSGVPLLPSLDSLSLEHYQWLFTYKNSTAALASDFIVSFLRTFSVASLNMVIIVFITAITGFVFSRFQFRGKKSLLLTMMLLQMFPSFMGMIALFMIYRSFGWLNNPLYLVFIYVTGSIPANTFLVRGYLRGIPKSIDEAATIDGATKSQIFFKLLLPLSKPILGFIAVTAFMGPWMDFMLPNQLLNMQSQTVAIFLWRLTDKLQPFYYQPLHFMAGALILAIPIMAVQIYMQKFIVYGMASGADKG